MTTPITATVYYHADCLDGFGAACAARRRFGAAASYLPMHHGQSWSVDDVAGREVFIVDFSFPVAELEAMAAQARSVVQIDHHASARDMWADRLDADGRHVHPQLPLQLFFDMDKSGARLAWEYFQPEQPLPLLLAAIEDQDLWRFRLPQTRPLCRALHLQPFDFAVWDDIIDQCATPDSPRTLQMLAEGGAIERFFAEEVDKLAGGRLPMSIALRGKAGPVHGLAANASSLFASELGDRLAEQSGSYSVIWQLVLDKGAPLVKASLRARGAVDVAALAECYGGGGHPNAAGFRMAPDAFFKLLGPA